MATDLGKNCCILCKKDKSTLRCGGCLQEYCFNHSLDHRQDLNKQLDEVEKARHLFRQILIQQTIDPEKHLLIQQINDWERESILKIRQTADEARQTLLKYTSSYVKEIEANLNKLTEQIRQSREDNDFYETDIRYWNDELKRLEKELTKPSNINLRQDNTVLVNKISVGITESKYMSYFNKSNMLSFLLEENRKFIIFIIIAITNTSIPDTTTSSTTVITTNVKENKNRIIVVGGNGQGNGLDQLNCPNGIYVDNDQTIYIAEWSNHRIIEWKNGATSGQIVAGGNGQGNQTDQLSNPTDVLVDKENNTIIICDYGNKRLVRWPCHNGTHGEIIISDIACWGLAMDNNRYLYVSDIHKHEVKRYAIGDTNGIVVAGGFGQGARPNQLNYPYYIFVDQDHSVYVSDGNNHRVVKWMKGAKEGILVAGVHGKGNGMTQLSNPRGLAVNQLGTIYVADCSNYRVMRWAKGASQGNIVVGGNGQGAQSNQFSAPLGLTFDRQGNLYVVDYGNNRVQKFDVGLNLNT